MLSPPGPADAAAAHATLVVMRHGESVGNAAGAFAGWRDVPLSERGRAQAVAAAPVLAGMVTRFDAVFTSELQRATHTAELVLAALAAGDVQHHRRWRLNERHCGTWQGRAKADLKQELGKARLRAMRWSWHEPLPAVEVGSTDDPRNEPRYATVPDELPRGESLQALAARVGRVFDDDLAPRLRRGETLLVVGHGLALRAMLRPLEGLTEERLVDWLPGNATPRCYRLAADLRVLAIEGPLATDGLDE